MGALGVHVERVDRGGRFDDEGGGTQAIENDIVAGSGMAFAGVLDVPGWVGR